MWTRSLIRWAVALVVASAGVGVGVATAQQSPSSGTPAAANTGGSGGAAAPLPSNGVGGPSTIDTQQSANLPPAQQMTQASGVVETLQNQRRTIQGLLDQAQQRGDIIKVNCLSDKLTQMDTALGSAREQQGLLENAIGLNNDGQRNHHFTVMTLLRGRAEGIMAEARQCVGEERTNYSDRAQTTVQVNSNIATQDTTNVTTVQTSMTPVMNSMSPLM